jgi:hypothetical protein
MNTKKLLAVLAASASLGACASYNTSPPTTAKSGDSTGASSPSGAGPGTAAGSTSGASGSGASSSGGSASGGR